MAQTVAGMTSVEKDAWTSQELAKSFYDHLKLLGRMRQVQATVIGLQAQVPVQKYRGVGGYTSTDAAGGVLNPAGNQQTAQATYTMVYHWFQTAIETGALNQTASNAQSIISARDLEIQGAVSDVSNHCARQLATNGDGFIAQCAAGGASTTVQLQPASVSGMAGTSGYDAIARGWLYPGQLVDIGTTADTDTLVTGTTITDVVESETAPTITIGSSITTTTSHFVSVANPNSATASNPELNGLRNMVSAGSLGGINPASAGNNYWQPSALDTTTTTFSLDLALQLSRKVYTKTGDYASTIITSPKQAMNLYSLLQNQVRFAADGNMTAGDFVSVGWNGMELLALPEIADKDWFQLSFKDLVRIVGDITEPTWVSDLSGTKQAFGNWTPNSTAFNDAVVFPFQVGMQRRNGSAAATNLVS
jgi:hypothetical protein